jgi:hypothetical protein
MISENPASVAQPHCGQQLVEFFRRRGQQLVKPPLIALDQRGQERIDRRAVIVPLLLPRHQVPIPC